MYKFEVLFLIKININQEFYILVKVIHNQKLYLSMYNLEQLNGSSWYTSYQCTSSLDGTNQSANQAWI